MNTLILEEEAQEAIELAEALPDRPDVLNASATLVRAYKAQQEKLGRPLFPQAEKRKTEDFQRVRGYFTNRETYGLDDDTRAGLLRDLPDEEQRAALFSEEFLARAFQKPTKEVRALGPLLRDQYALERWGEPVKTYKEFYDRQAAEFELEDEINAKAIKAALGNVRTIDALSTFIQERAEDPAYKGREKQRQDQFLRSVAQARAEIAPYSKMVDVVISHLEEKTGVSDTGEEVRSYRELAETLLEVPEEDRDTVLSAILNRGSGGDEAALKSYAQKLGENFGRGFLDFTEGIPAFAERGQALAVLRDIGAKVPAGKASTPEDYLQALAAKASGGLAYEQGEFLTSAMGKEFEAPSRKVKEQAAGLAERALQGIDLRAKIRSIAETGIDPATSENRVARGLLQASRSAPYTLVALAPGGVYINSAAMLEQNYQALRASDPNLSREDAQAISAVSAPLQAFIERGQANLAVGRLKLLNQLFNKVSVTKGAVARRFLGRGAMTATGEMLQENLQDATPFITQEVFSALSGDVPGVDWEGQFGEMLKQQPDLFFSILPLALIGAGAGTVSDYKESAAMLANPKRIAATIGNTAKASEIASLARSGNLIGAQTMLQEEFSKVGADAKPLQEVRREAVQSLALEAEQQRAAVERGEQIGIIPVVTPTKAGWMVRFNDQTEQTFPTYSEADAARWEHSGIDNFRFHEDITATISHADRTQREGQGVRYVFGQERKTLLDAKQSGQSSASAALNRADEAAADAQVSDATIPTDEELKASVEGEYQEGMTVAEIKALSEDDRLAAFTILGENSTEFENGIFVTTAKLQAGATWATVIEEKLEGDAFVMLKDGRRDWLLQSLRDFEKIANEPIFRPGIKDSEITDGDIKGAYARAGIAYFVGTADEQKGFQRGEKFKKRYDSLVAAGLSGSMEGYARFFMAVAQRADALNAMRKAGALDTDLERELARSVGYGEQAEFDAGVMEDAGTFAKEMGSEVEFEPTAPFSVITNADSRIAEMFSPFHKEPGRRRELMLEVQRRAARELRKWDADTVGKKDRDRAHTVSAMRTLQAMISALPSEVQGKVGGQVRLAQFKSKGAMERFLADQVEKIDEVVESVVKKEAREQIEGTFKKARAKRESGKGDDGRLGAFGHAWFDYAEKVAELSPTEVDGEVSKIEGWLEQGELSDDNLRFVSEWVGEPVTDQDSARDYLEERLNIAGIIGGVLWGKIDTGSLDRRNQISAEDMAIAADLTEEVYTGKRFEWMREIALRRERREEAREAMAKKLGGKNSDPKRIAKAQADHTSLVQKLEGYFDNGLDFATVIDDLFGDSSVARTLIRGLRKADGAEKDGIIQRRAEFNDLMKKAFPKLGTVGRNAKLYDLATDKAIKGVSINSTPAYMSETKAIHYTMLAADPDSREWLQSHGYNDEVMEGLENFLSDEALIIRDWLVERYDEQYWRINAVHRALKGTNMPRIKMYAPRMVEHMMTATDGDLTSPEALAGGMSTGFTKRRVQSPKGEPKPVDSLAAYWSNAFMVEHYISHAEFVGELKATLGHKDTRLAIETNRGREKARQVSQWVRDIDQGGRKCVVTSKFISRVTESVARTALGYKLAVLVKQMPAAIASAARIGIGEYAKSFQRVSRGKGAVSMLEMYRSPIVQRRIDQYGPEMKTAFKSGQKAFEARLIFTKGSIAADEFLDFGMDALGWTDAGFTTLSAAVAFDSHYNAAIKSGLDETTARAIAWEQTDDTVARTAQPDSVATKSQFELGLGALRVLFMFQGPSRQAFAMTYLALKQSLRGEQGARGRLARQVFFHHFVVGSLLQTVGNVMRMVFSDDEPEEIWEVEDYLKAWIVGPLTGALWFGTAADAIASALGGFERRFAPNDPTDLGRLVFAFKDLFDGEVPSEAEILRVLQTSGEALGGSAAALGVGVNIWKQVTGLWGNIAGD